MLTIHTALRDLQALGMGLGIYRRAFIESDGHAELADFDAIEDALFCEAGRAAYGATDFGDLCDGVPPQVILLCEGGHAPTVAAIGQAYARYLADVTGQDAGAFMDKCMASGRDLLDDVAELGAWRLELQADLQAERARVLREYAAHRAELVARRQA